MSNNKDRNLVDMNTGILPTEDEIYAQGDKDINITASGTSIQAVTVLTYNATTNIGTGTVNSTGAPITFTNGTGYYLVYNDVVAVATDTDGNNVAVAIISRAGQLTPTVIPGVTLAAGFPKQTDSGVLTYGIQGPFSELINQTFTVDPTGNFGYDVNAIYGYGGVAATINGINTVSGTNFSIGAVPNFSTSSSSRYLFINPSGMMFAWDRINTTHNMSYRDKKTDSFHTIMVNYNPSSSLTIAYDDSNGALWYENANNVFNKWFDGETSPTTVTLTGNTAITRLVAGNGYLFGIAGTTLYRKASNNTSDWTVVYSGAITLGTHYAAGADGLLYVLFESGTPSKIKIERYGSTVDILVSTIDGSLGSGYVRGAGLAVNSSNIPYFTLIQRADLLYPAGTSSQYGVGLYAANFYDNTTPILAADSSMYQSVNVTFEYGNSLMIIGTNAYWMNGFQGSGLTTTYKLQNYSLA